jgi:nicotinamide phosphoribosyltransferase
MIDEAEVLIKAHGEPFNREGFHLIVDKYNGYFPVTIVSLPEGVSVTRGVPSVAVWNTDYTKETVWCVSFIETALLSVVWYMSTVMTNSAASRRIIKEYLEKTGDVSGLDFKLHDFGFRGVSSTESAGLGGVAHLATGFMGTDTIAALLAGRRYYGADMAGFSIPAMEHSTVTSWGRSAEEDSYRNMLKQFGGKFPILAAVSDSYNIYEACKMWGTRLKQDVIDSGSVLVVRPDSGVPHVVVTEVAKILDQYFGSTLNSKGYKVLNNVRIIQGDGINTQEISRILFNLTNAGYSADNVAFGQGGALLQKVTRDDYSYAMKASARLVGDTWIGFSKDPVGDRGKKSLEGVFGVRRNAETDRFECYNTTDPYDMGAMRIVYQNGVAYNETTLDQIRKVANSHI